MQTLFAPWRMIYIEDIPSASGCFLCDLQNAAPHKDNLMVLKTKSHMVVMNKFPYNPCHLLIAPLRHIPSPLAMAEDEWRGFYKLQMLVMGYLEDILKPQGFNVGMNLGAAAGAGLPSHVHLHIVPRWVGDANFMPVLGDTKVIPEAMDATYEKLLPLRDIVAQHNL